MTPRKPRTHCAHGHDWRLPNSYFLDSDGTRRCYECRRQLERRRKKDPAAHGPIESFKRIVEAERLLAERIELESAPAWVKADPAEAAKWIEQWRREQADTLDSEG